MKLHQKLVLLAVLVFSISCTREQEKPAASIETDAAPAIVFSKTLDFPRVYSLLAGHGADQRAAGRAIAGQFVDWEVYILSPYEWDPGRGEKLKKFPSLSGDGLKRELQLAEHPQRYLIAPSTKDSGGIVMRVGDGFKDRDQFGRIVSGFAIGQKLRVRGRVLVGGEGSVELGVYEIAPSNTP